MERVKKKKTSHLRGARQVGKTWILEEFGKEFADWFVRINFDKEPEHNQFFEKSKDVKRIIHNLSFDGKILNIPLYLIDEFDRLLKLV